jgi:hypothetical protein
MRRDEEAGPRIEGGRGPGSPARKRTGKADVLAKIAEMQEPDRSMAEELHSIIKANAPYLSPRTWYGMRAMGGTAVVCFFQTAPMRRLASATKRTRRRPYVAGLTH